MAAQKTILIVDDNVVFLKAMSGLLQPKGYHVFTAVDSAVALNTVRQQKPDLILLDINFPPDVGYGGIGWNGFQIIGWLRRMDEAKGVPIILITEDDPAKYAGQALGTEVVAFFRKSVSQNELLTTIRDTLAGGAKQPPPGIEMPVAHKILFVDDENDWRYMAMMYLTDAGFEVWTARDATEALNLAGKVRPDLVILDGNLGGESGLVVMKLLKERHPGVPILLYTGMDCDQEVVQAMLREGASQHLPKTTMGELLKAVQ
ncbi:MAG: response regulator, partial [Verrucomicrobia bacterium]|nr:response regulator [Verrucomicrobiota bacterium]